MNNSVWAVPGLVDTAGVVGSNPVASTKTLLLHQACNLATAYLGYLSKSTTLQSEPVAYDTKTSSIFRW